jgi:CRISPR/Cas system-associated exonuclease Cas4 (RecB family)
MSDLIFPIQQIINKNIIEDREPREITSWHCSGFGSCPTGRYLERLGVPPDSEFDERTLRVFSCGNKFEDWAVELLKDDAYEFETQTRVENPTWNVSGRVDVIMTHKDTGIRRVVEIKSKHSRAFHWMNKKGEGAMYHHKMQLWLYLKMLAVPTGSILYISKDDMSMLEYPVRVDDAELEAKVMEEINLLNLAWLKKLPPPPPTDPKDWRCTYCRWHKQCTNLENYLPL